jgi:methylthioribose-1-phosphate isomerase
MLIRAELFTCCSNKNNTDKFIIELFLWIFMEVNGIDYRTVWADSKGNVSMIDQNKLPHEFRVIDSPNYRTTAKHIKDMTVRGAGCIGSTAGYAMAQAFYGLKESDGEKILLIQLEDARRFIESARPTARNLFYATERVYDAGIEELQIYGVSQARNTALSTAQLIANEDVENCRMIGVHAMKSDLIREGFRVMTHCNAGWLAFTNRGSATAPLYAAHDAGIEFEVWVGETGPRGQGAMLTEWELSQYGIENEIFSDNAAGKLMMDGLVDVVIVGADRIAANGDVVNKIGTYMRAVLADYHGIPFYVAAPTTTIDLETRMGRDVEIEERDAREVLWKRGITRDGRIEEVRIASEGASAINYAFDVTPAKLVTGIITEKGIIKPNEEEIRSLFE